jgi:D-alanine-D-alanine ligase
MGMIDDTSKLAQLREMAASVSQEVKTVALLYGGTSGEREVSIASGNGVKEVLEAEGFDVAFIDTGAAGFVKQLLAAKPDIAFIALHGFGGEDGRIQGFLETLQIPYTHSGVKASAIAMDKRISKVLYAQAGLATADYLELSKDSWLGGDTAASTTTAPATDAAITPTPAPAVPGGTATLATAPASTTTAPADTDALLAEIGLPCVVKPSCDGSSLGVSIPKERTAFIQAIKDGFEIGDKLLIEQFISGVEVTVPVVGNRCQELFALSVIEIVPKNEFYDYESKYSDGGSVHIIPARISERETALCQQAAIEAHVALGCAGVSRTDMIVTADGTPYLIETNTIPGMTRTSLIPEDAQKYGLTPGELYRLLIYFGLKRGQD